MYSRNFDAERGKFCRKDVRQAYKNMFYNIMPLLCNIHIYYTPFYLKLQWDKSDKMVNGDSKYIQLFILMEGQRIANKIVGY